MVQKESSSEGERRPGRPRAYDPQVALQRATEAFWDAGYSGTSLDDLSNRTGMNRPSLYAAFGDKQALYLKTLESYIASRRVALVETLSSARPLPEGLRELFERIIERFVSGERGARGCYLVGTAATEAVQNPEVREMLARSVRELDEIFGAAFLAARARGELDRRANPRALAMVASSVVQALALRARSGQSRAVLRAVADSAVALICGPGPKGKGRSKAPRRQTP